MKLLHLADLHIGKQIQECSALKEQRRNLVQAVHMAVEHKVAAVLVAGDIYDRPMPPADAVCLFQYFLEELSKEGIPVCIVSGNHDPANRLFFGKDLPKKALLYIAEAYTKEVSRVTFFDKFGEVDVYLLPFFKPQQIRQQMIEEGIEESQLENYTEAVRTALKGLPLRKHVRNVLVTHQNVIEDDNKGMDEDSRSAGAVGNEANSTKDVDIVDYRVFDGFDYVALGHVHDAGQVGRATVRHAGSLIDYSGAGAVQRKSATLISLEEKGSIAIEELGFMLPDGRQETKGTLEQFREFFYQQTGNSMSSIQELTLNELTGSGEDAEELTWQLKERVRKLRKVCEQTDQVMIQYYMDIECPETAGFFMELAAWKKQPDIHMAEEFQERLAQLAEEDRREYELCRRKEESCREELESLNAMEQEQREFQKKKEELKRLLWLQENSSIEEENEEAKRKLFFAKKAVISVRPLKEAYLAARKEREELIATIKSKERQLVYFKEQEEDTLLHYQKAQADKSGLEQLSLRVEQAKTDAENVRLRTRLIEEYKQKAAELTREDGLLEERSRRQKELEEECAACRHAVERLLEIYHQGTALEKEEHEVKQQKAALTEQKRQFESYEATKKNYEYLAGVLSEKLELQEQLQAQNKQAELAALKAETEKLSKEAAMEQGTAQLLAECLTRPRDATEPLRLDSIEAYEKEETRLSAALSKVLSEIEVLLEEQTLCIQAKNRVPELEKRIAEERAAADLLQDRLHGIRSELQGIEREIKKLTLPLDVTDEAEAGQRLSVLLAEQEQKRQEIAKAETAYYEWDDANQNEAEILEQLLGRKAACARKEQEAEEAYFAALKAAGFDTETEYDRAVLWEAQIEELERQIQQKDAEIAKRKERIRALKQETAKGMDAGFLKKRLEEVRAEAEAKAQELSVLGSRIETNEKIRQRAEGQIKIREQLQKEYSSICMLAVAAEEWERYKRRCSDNDNSGLFIK